MILTLIESLAMAIIRGDLVAGYALMDQLLELRDSPTSKQERAATLRSQGNPKPDGYEVYSWPEFKAFANRLGILWDAFTISIAIRLTVDEQVDITQVYRGQDVGGTT